MIGEQENTRSLKVVKLSPPINKTDAEKRILKIQRALNNAAWEKATRPLLDGGKGENSVNSKLQWENRQRLNIYVSTVECRGEKRVQDQARQETCGTVQGVEEI